MYGTFNNINKTSGLPDSQKEQTPVGKTLMIGMGGTGKEVLLRLRRLIVERYGSLDRLPCIQFLDLDTDKTVQAQQQYDRNVTDDPLYEKIMFQPIERINLLVEGGTNKYIGNINTYPHIREWFNSTGKIANLGDLGEGAGQVRMASRLGFYHNYNKIESGLEQAKRRLMSETIRTTVSQIGFDFDTNLMNIYVISSLAGGTGSGTFIDMGFLLKTMFKDSVRMGIFFLPSFFSGYAGADRMKANGYAALMELNHYSFGNPFNANWSGQGIKQIIPPPFDYTYLLEGQNEANEGIGSSNEEFSMYQMVSEIIFQDFSQGEFSGLKRAIRVNLKNYIDDVYVHDLWTTGDAVGINTGRGNISGDSYTTRFCSFGLSAITFPVEKVRRACACRLANNILNYWQRNIIKEPLDELFVKFLSLSDIQCVQGQYTRRDGGGTIESNDIEKALLWYNKESGKDFQNYLWQMAVEIRNDIEERDDKEKGTILQEHREKIEKLFAKEDSEHADEWGLLIRIIHSNMNNYLDILKKGLQENANKKANDSKYGISYSLSLLQEFKKLIQDNNYSYLPYFEENITYWNNAVSQYYLDLEQIHMDIEKHARQILFRKADLERDINFLVDSNSEEDAGILYNYLYARVMKQVSKKGKKICEEIDKFLGDDDPNGRGLISKFHQLTRGFDELKRRISKKENYYSKVEQFATIKTLYKESDVDLWYKKWMGHEEESKSNLEIISKELLTQIFGVNSVTEALIYIQKNSNEVIEEQVIERCRIFFESHEIQPSALEMLMDDSRCSVIDRKNLIQSAYKRAKVWLKQSYEIEQVSFKISNHQKPCIIGIDLNDDVRINDFKEILKTIQDASDLPPQYKNIGDKKKSSLIFYNELGGATAFYPSSISEVGGLKQNYVKYCRNPKEVDPDNDEEVHIHKNRFQFSDIIPKTSVEIKKYSESIRAFVLARILGLLKIQEEKSVDHTVINYYSYEQESHFSMIEHNLGDEYSAVDILYTDPSPEYDTHRKFLLQQIEEDIMRMQEKRLLAVYLLLIEFYLENVYPVTTQTTEINNVQYRRLTPFHAALEFERHNRVIKELAPTKQEQVQLDHALQKLRKKPKKFKLKYIDYLEALEPFTKKMGKFKIYKHGGLNEGYEFRDSLILDRKKIFEQYNPDAEEENKEKEYDYNSRTDVTPKKEKHRPENEKRKCPSCGKLINIRAIKCSHCRKKIATHITCQYCGEEKVPDDLQECWRCGREPAKQEEKIECQVCFDYIGHISKEKPCPKCGWDPSQSIDIEDEETLGDEDSQENDENQVEQDEYREIDEVNDNESYNTHNSEKKKVIHHQGIQVSKSETNEDESKETHEKEVNEKEMLKEKDGNDEHQNEDEHEDKNDQLIVNTKEKSQKTTPKRQIVDADSSNSKKTKTIDKKFKEKKVQKESPSSKPEKIECPNCFEMVPKGPICENCGEYL